MATLRGAADAKVGDLVSRVSPNTVFGARRSTFSQIQLVILLMKVERCGDQCHESKSTLVSSLALLR